jgi:hypothetical protein
MFVAWKSRALAPVRRAGCAHSGRRRYAMQPLICVYSATKGSGREVLASLPVFRSCCLRDAARRAKWWSAADAEIEKLRRMSRRRHLDAKRDALVRGRRWEKDLEAIEFALRSRIPRPQKVTTTKLAEKAAKEAEEAAIAKAMRTSHCWGVLGLPPGAPARMVRDALKERKERLRREGATLSAFREVQDAAMESIQRLQSGIW